MVLLFVFIHGNHGSSRDFSRIEEKLLAELSGSVTPNEIFCLRSDRNSFLGTHTGILQCGERLKDEVVDFVGNNAILKNAKSVGLVVVGHSLGGLIGRACLPALLSHEVARAFVPISFVTLSTPHLGSRRPVEATFLKTYGRVATHAILSTFNGLTGKELLLLDESPHVLCQLAEPKGAFMTALRKFSHVTFIAIPHYDVLVPYCSAAALPFNRYHTSNVSQCKLPTVLGHSGFENASPKYRTHLLQCPLQRVARLPNQPQKQVEEMPPFTRDNFSEVEFLPELPAKLAEGLPHLRRLDVQFCFWIPQFTHHVMIDKLPLSTAQGQAFVSLLIQLLKLDVEDYLTVATST